MEHLFASLNQTELYQLCAKAGLKAAPSYSRDELIALLSGWYDSIDENQHIIDTWRHGLAGFVLDHWKILQNQVKCPLMSKDPKSCFGCLDTQVIACVASNPTNERLIQLHRK